MAQFRQALKLHLPISWVIAIFAVQLGVAACIRIEYSGAAAAQGGEASAPSSQIGMLASNR